MGQGHHCWGAKAMRICGEDRIGTRWTLPSKKAVIYGQNPLSPRKQDGPLNRENGSKHEEVS